VQLSDEQIQAQQPGPGMGGHCLPVDPFYLAFKAREHDFYWRPARVARAEDHRSHPEVDHGAVVSRAPLVVDFRDVTRAYTPAARMSRSPWNFLEAVDKASRGGRRTSAPRPSGTR